MSKVLHVIWQIIMALLPLMIIPIALIWLLLSYFAIQFALIGTGVCIYRGSLPENSVYTSEEPYMKLDKSAHIYEIEIGGDVIEITYTTESIGVQTVPAAFTWTDTYDFYRNEGGIKQNNFLFTGIVKYNYITDVIKIFDESGELLYTLKRVK